jgi:enediyne biosynthesis protein E4
MRVLLGLTAVFVASTLHAQELWQTEGQVRWRALPEARSRGPGFTLLSPAGTGLGFTNLLDEAVSAKNRVLENGSGVAIGDYDNDGRPDVFLCSLQGSNALFRNLGNWRFTNVTVAAGLTNSASPTRGAVLIDINGDSTLDLLISTVSEGVHCFLNDGKGHFSDQTRACGLERRSGSTTLAFADVDGNRTLDVYVTNYRADDIRDRARIDIVRVGGKLSVAPSLRDRVAITESGLLEFGEPDVLYLNDGKGRFTAVTWDSGRFRDEEGRPLATAPLDWGLAATFRDINGDSAPDLYVCNDYWTPDRLWLNDGRGVFHAMPPHMLGHTSANSMGVDFGDVNGDGHLDFFVTDMLYRSSARRKRQISAQAAPPPSIAVQHQPQIMQNTLFLNRGDATFAEIASLSDVAASDWSWQPSFMDVDLDGLDDLVIPAGHTRDVQDADATARIQSLQHPWPRQMDPLTHQQAFTRELMEHARLYPGAAAPIYTFRNTGDLRFEDKTAEWGTSQAGVHQGIAFGDLDQDGDLDFVVNNLNSAVGIYRNDSGAPRVAVRLRGNKSDAAAVGARATLFGGPVPLQTREVVAGGRYLSGSDPLLVFAIGRQASQLKLEIRWRDGSVTRIPDLKAGRLYEIHAN